MAEETRGMSPSVLGVARPHQESVGPTTGGDENPSCQPSCQKAFQGWLRGSSLRWGEGGLHT